MATYEYVEIDGCKVEKDIATQFKKMAKAFEKQFGLTLHVRSGMRTRESQQKLYDKYRAGNGPQASPPGYSHHEAENKDGVGPIALDLYDSGKDAGVKYIGTVRNNWLAKNARRWGFVNTGRAFKNPEGWHFEGSYVKAMLAAEKDESIQKPPASSGRAPSALPNKYGLVKMEGLQKIANMWTDGKKTAIDNRWGDLSQGGFDDFLRKNYGGTKDAALAAWLRKKWGYKGDDTYGPNMKAALERANAANDKALD